MKFKWYQLICLFCVILIINCNDKKAVSEPNVQNKIQGNAIQKYKNTHSFIIKFNSLIYEKDGKELRVPIFQGEMGNVTYKEFRKYCLDNKYLEPNVAESSFVIKADKGKLTKTFRDFLNFYKKSILKNVNINKPTKINVYDEGGLSLYYDFEINGVPFVLQLEIITDDKIESLDSVKPILDVHLDEGVKDPIFRYRFWDDYTSEEL
ncbi:MAG TPA: hypothetical protein PK358_17145 [Spirochaetota bacterium]|nr:hypothetical protein [Spirochaetota bacterium]